MLDHLNIFNKLFKTEVIIHNNNKMAGINRFDSPAQYQAINTYVPIPFEQMAQAAIYRQNKADQQGEKLDEAYNKANNLRYIKNSKDQLKIEEVQRVIDDLSTKYSSPEYDMSDPMVQREINSTINRTLNNQQIQSIQRSAEAYDMNEKLKAQLNASGKYNKILDEDPNLIEGGYDTETMGIYGYQTPAWEQYRPVAEDYFNNIKDSILTDAKGRMLTTGEGYNITGVDLDKIKSVAKSKITSFLDSNAGKQQVKIARNRLERIYGKDVVDEMSDDAIAYDTLLEVGEEYIRKNLTGSRTSSSSNGTNNPFWDLPATFEGDNVNQTWDPYNILNSSYDITKDTNSEIAIEYNSIPSDLDEEYVDENGKVIRVAHSNEKTISNNKRRAALLNQYKNEKLQEFKTDFGIEGDYSQEELTQIYKDVSQDLQSLKSTIMSVPIDYARSLRLDYGNTIHTREIQIFDENGNPITNLGRIGNEEIDNQIKKLGFESTFEFTEKLSNPDDKTFSVNGLSPSSNIPGSVTLKVYDKTKKGPGGKGFKKIVISPSTSQQAAIAPINNMIKAYNKATPFESQYFPANFLYADRPGASFKVKIQPKTGVNGSLTKENGKWTYSPNLEIERFSPEGESLGTTKISEYDLAKIYHAGYLTSSQSGVRGSDNVSFRGPSTQIKSH